jgi:hypothetical protein
MQIKKNPTTKGKSNTDLVRRWLEMTLPPITGFIVLPYLFLFLGSLYSTEFHSIPAQTLFYIIGVQGILLIVTPLVTAWITLKRVSKQLQSLAQVISQAADKISKSTFASDNWVTLEKQKDDLGLAARKIKAAILETKKNNSSNETTHSLEHCSNKDSCSDYSSLFSLNIQGTNTQVY